MIESLPLEQVERGKVLSTENVIAVTNSVTREQIVHYGAKARMTTSLPSKEDAISAIKSVTRKLIVLRIANVLKKTSTSKQEAVADVVGT
jgi:hypothetical protein